MKLTKEDVVCELKIDQSFIFVNNNPVGKIQIHTYDNLELYCFKENCFVCNGFKKYVKNKLVFLAGDLVQFALKLLPLNEEKLNQIRAETESRGFNTLKGTILNIYSLPKFAQNNKKNNAIENLFVCGRKDNISKAFRKEIQISPEDFNSLKDVGRFKEKLYSIKSTPIYRSLYE